MILVRLGKTAESREKKCQRGGALNMRPPRPRSIDREVRVLASGLKQHVSVLGLIPGPAALKEGGELAYGIKKTA